MCGISGFLAEQVASKEYSMDVGMRMAQAIASRGPDDSGVWVDIGSGVVLSHRRLSVLDLTGAGHQPMHSHSGRFVLVFNGEIYNHLKLRDEMPNVVWQGHSDTETLLAGFDYWGVDKTIQKSVGMFAFALWDFEEGSLTLARDRLGEKPLYYGWQDSSKGATFFFGSELKAIKAHPYFLPEIDRGALSLLMRHGYIPAPYSIYKGIHKLLPGNILKISLRERGAKSRAYWSLQDVAIKGVKNIFTGSSIDAISELESHLRASVRQQMVADVPLGAFLSGGVDSSTIAAIMQTESNRPIQTFTIGFDEDGYNEAGYAKEVARHLGTDHNELYITPRQALDVIPRIPELYCEPFADSSQIPTYLVSSLARTKVTVALSGDGGDELFCGYNRYLLASNLWAKISYIPEPLRVGLSRLVRAVSPGSWDSLLMPLISLAPNQLKYKNVGDKLHKAAGIISMRDIQELYLALVSHWDPNKLVIGSAEPITYLRGQLMSLNGLDDVQRMMVIDSITYLPDDILVKVDRAAMGVSLEGRMPFLDHRLIEFAWTLPQSMKIKSGDSKWILREVLFKYVPKHLIDRPKMGFGVPIGVWLRGPLRDWAETYLDESKLRSEGYFNPAIIREKWQEHLSGKRNWQYLLWNVLMFQTWLERNS